MKNIQIIDGAANSIFEIYEVDDFIFNEIFTNDKDVVFISDVCKYSDFTKEEVMMFWQKVYSCRKNKKSINGIHGTLHLEGSNCRKNYYPEGKEDLIVAHPLSKSEIRTIKEG